MFPDPASARPEDGFDMNRAFRDAKDLFGENAGLFTGLTLVFGIPGAIAEAATRESGFVAIMVALVIASAAGTISEAAITLGALRRVKGQAVGNDVLASGLNFYAPVFVAVMLGSLAVLFGLVLFILPGIIVAALLFFAVPAILEEGLGGVKGLERSMALGAGHRMEIFLMIFLFMVVWLGVALLFDSLLSSAPLLATFATWLVGGVIGAFGTILAVTSYAQLRELSGMPIGSEVDLDAQARKKPL